MRLRGGFWTSDGSNPAVGRMTRREAAQNTLDRQVQASSRSWQWRDPLDERARRPARLTAPSR